jgi:hypothetical protein
LLTQFKVLHVETTGATSDGVDDELNQQAYLEEHTLKKSAYERFDFDEDNEDEVSAHLSNVYATYWFVM